MNLVVPDRYRDEQVFIRQVLYDPEDLTSRLVYADWLDERKDVRAKLLKLDVELAGLNEEDLQVKKVRDERAALLKKHKVDRVWLGLMGMAKIEKCAHNEPAYEPYDPDEPETPPRAPEPEFQIRYRCPLRWENLSPIDDNHQIRFCNECQKTVHYCLDTYEARDHAAQGRCVAIDFSARRSPHDLNYSNLNTGEFLGRLEPPSEPIVRAERNHRNRGRS